jgi:hypothetical protein
MKPRSKKYHANKKTDDGSKKGSANKGGYNEQNETTINKPNEHPAASETEEKEQALKK